MTESRIHQIRVDPEAYDSDYYDDIEDGCAVSDDSVAENDMEIAVSE